MDRAREAEVMGVAAHCQETERKSCRLRRHYKDLALEPDLEAGTARARETSLALQQAQGPEWFHLRRDFRARGTAAAAMVVGWLPAVMA
jgi:hypothetical protein